MMKNYFIIVLILFSVTVNAEQAFEETELGYKFYHADVVTLDFNPHSLRKFHIFFNNEPVGGFAVSVLPEDFNINDFLNSGTTYYKRKYEKIDVESSEHINKNSLTYYKVRVSGPSKAGLYLEDRFIFIKNRPGVLSKKGINMTYTFNFVYIKNDVNLKIENLFRLVDSFEFIESNPYTNEAVRRIYNKKYNE